MTTYKIYSVAATNEKMYRKQLDKGKIADNTILVVDGVCLNIEPWNWVELDESPILPEPYWRNLLPTQAIKDGKAVLQLEPDTKYYLMSWNPSYNEETGEYDDGYHVEHFTTGTTGKKTIKNLEDGVMYKLAKAETYWTQAPEDLMPDLFPWGDDVEEEEEEEIPETTEPETEEPTEPEEVPEPETEEPETEQELEEQPE